MNLLSNKSYAELVCRSSYSFLRGASQPEELARRAVEINLPALAITDLNGVYAIPKTWNALKDTPSTQLISGSELRVENQSTPIPHQEIRAPKKRSAQASPQTHPIHALDTQESLILLATDRAAYGRLCRLLTEAHRNREKGQGGMSLETFFQSPTDGLMILIPETMHERVTILREAFSENLYLCLSRRLDGHDRARTEKTLRLSRTMNIPLVATNDVVFHEPARQALHQILVCTRHGTTLSNSAPLIPGNSERYLKSPLEMQRLFSDLPQALHATLEIAERCTFRPSELRYRYPSEWIPQPHTAQSYLEQLTWKGAEKRYRKNIPENVARQIHHELELIRELQFADYFLTIDDIVAFARSRNILCQGRGSAANSVICYCLGITAIDPVRMNLLFERFISRERGEPPDIDVDFEHERREEVIHYIYEKYGRDRAAMVSAVVTYRRRSAFREIAKAFGVDVGTASAREVEKTFESRVGHLQIPRLREQIQARVEELKGFPRHLSIHSGGFTLSADPMIEIVPVEPASMEGRTIIQWDKYDLDILGLLKIDVLCLGMLTAIHKTLDLIGMDITQIPAEDKATYAMIQRADTVGTFQIESRAQMNMLGRLQPRNFYDLVIEVAIVRPGPIVGKMVHPYLRRRRGLEKPIYPDARVERILGKTLGVPLFQEQVMKLAVELAGFTPGQSDELRRAVNGWRSNGSIPQVAQRLMEGLLKSGLPIDFAQDIFEKIQGFSMYGFPESHAASFALIAYASCWLKCHHPGPFTCGLLNSQPMGFYAPHSLIDDARRHGVPVLPVDPHHSEWDCTMEGTTRPQALRLGFRLVDGIAKSAVEDLLKARTEKPFEDFNDFLQRTRLRRDVLIKMALGNSFACFNLEPRKALWTILGHALFFRNQSPEETLPQLYTPSSVSLPLPSLSDYDAIRFEYEAFHVSTRAHPMEVLRKHLSLPRTTIAQARQARHNQRLSCAGLVLVRQRPPTANGTTFSVLEDEYGFLDLVIFKSVSDRYRETLLSECFLQVSGVIHRDGHSLSLVVQSMASLWPQSPQASPSSPSSGESEQLRIEPKQFFH